MFHLTRSPRPVAPGPAAQASAPAREPRSDGVDFVTVDGGTFEYAPSAAAVIRNFEYPGQAQCILDRAGNNYPLLATAEGGLALGTSMGKANLAWLRRAWADAQRDQSRAYPLLRDQPATDAGFLASLFEVLTAIASGNATWSVQVHRRKVDVQTLRDAGALLLREEDLSDAVVRDPYGHFYRPVRHRRSRLALTGRDFLMYRETGAP